MTQRQKWFIGVCLVLACVAWLIQCGHWKNWATTVTASLSWNSTEMCALEKEWQAIRDLPSEEIPGDDGKTKYCERLAMVERLFRNRLSEQNVYQLAGSCDALPVRVEDRDFEESVLAFLVKVLVELGDREAIVKLLSTRSPTWFDGIEPIECHLVVRGERLKDAILILGDAYSQCEVAETRHTLAAAVRRGFDSFDVGGWGDADYVKNAMQWYEKEKGRLEPNPQYVANEISSIKHPLFKEKAGPGIERGGGQPHERFAASAFATAASFRTKHVQTREKDFARLPGGWKVVSATHVGQSLPEEAFEGAELLFQNQMLIVRRAGWDDEKRFRIRVGRDKNLATIDAVGIGEPERDASAPALLNDLKNETTTGIYELQEESLRLCLAKPGAWRRPTSFVADSDATLLRLTRMGSAAANVPQPLKEITNSIGMKFVLVPTGEFAMGAPSDEPGREDDEIPQHPVRITKSFWLGAYEVTRLEYVMGDHRTNVRPNDVDQDVADTRDTRNSPVANVSWYTAAEFCNRLSKEEGFPAYYRLAADQRGAPCQVEELGGPGYRLPTEAEWEYACRAGTTTRFSFGQVIKEGQANVGRSPEPSDHPSTVVVGSFPENAFGLHDMHGNVAEWCNDFYDPRYYEDCAIDDPHGPAPAPSARSRLLREMVVRGGDCSNPSGAARSACRMHHSLDHNSALIGFRVARNVSGDWEQKLRDVAARDAAPMLTGHTGGVTCVTFSPDGKTLASASDDWTVRLWDVASRTNTATFDGHRHRVLSVAFSPDGKTVASAGEDAAIKLWDISTGRNTATLKGHTRGVACVEYSPDGKTLTSGSWDKTIRLWDLRTGKVSIVRTRSTHAVQYSPDGKTLASASSGGPRGTIQFWDAATGENIANSEASRVMIRRLAYSPDGKMLATANHDPTIRLWDAVSGKNVATVRQESGQINSIAYSPDGKTLASAAGGGESRQAWSGDTTVRLWDLTAGTNRVVLRGRPTGFRCVAFSQDGTALAAGGLDGTIRLIDASFIPSLANAVDQ